MRYYVLCHSDYAQISPHVVAEVVREGPDDDRATTLATALAGDRAIIATRAELLADPAGRRALEAWESDDDREYDHETDAMSAESAADGPPHGLRLVSGGDTPAKDRRRPRRGKSR